MKEESELETNLTPAQFYRDYIKDNLVFYELSDECWEVMKKCAGAIYEKAKELALYMDAWCAVEAAVRQVLSLHGINVGSW